MDFHMKPMGDRALSIVFRQEISPQVHRMVQRMNQGLMQMQDRGILETIPAYASIGVLYDPLLLTYQEACGLCRQAAGDRKAAQLSKPRLIEIPVLYGGWAGPDMAFVADSNGLTAEEVVQIHSAQPYLIYMLGFSPGFCFLGGMDERIATPRKEVPREKIAPGSVGIAGAQTGMYPVQSPGGWQLIGQTPLRLYEARRQPPVFYSSGDYIQYKAVDEETFHEVKALEAQGRYQWIIKEYEEGQG